MPICRICGATINPKKEIEGVDWCRPSVNYYYHVKCYEDWKVSKPSKDDEWIPLIYDFLSRDLKVTYNYFLCETQRKKYIKENKFTNKGIYFTLKYFYEIKKNQWDKGHGGIGIIPYTYKDSVNYWIEQEHKKRGFIEAIETQLKERSEREIKKIKQPQKAKEKIKYSLDDIGGEE